MTKFENIPLTVIITPLKLSPVCLWYLVRLGGYIVNLYVFYFFRLIGKLTAYLQFQKFSLCNPTMASSTTVVPCSPQSSNQNATASLTRVGDNFTYSSKFRCRVYSFTNTQSPITLANFLSIHLVFIFRCSCPPHNTVYP